MHLNSQRCGPARERQSTVTHVFTLFLFYCLLMSLSSSGTDSCQCGGKAVCVSGRRQHFIFPANSSGLAGPAHPSHQEPKPVASEVGSLICFCALILVVFSDIFQCIVCSLDLPQDHSSCLQLAFSDFLS